MLLDDISWRLNQPDFARHRGFDESDDQRVPAFVPSELLDAMAARHEAGHVVTSIALGRRVSRVSIYGRGLGGGDTQFQPINRALEVADVIKMVPILMSGLIAQRKFGAKNPIYEKGCTGDAEKVGKIISRLAPDQPENQERIYDRAMAEAHRLVNLHWVTIERVARALFERGSLDEDEIMLLTTDTASRAAPVQRRAAVPLDEDMTLDGVKYMRRHDGFLRAA